MTQTIDLKNGSFDYTKFQTDALEQIKNGQPLMREQGVLTPLIKQLIELSLEGEIEHHLANCKEDGLDNRRNGKTSKTLQTVMVLLS